MPNFPFTRAKPLGWSLFEVFTSAQANAVDANAAQAADGLIWTDAAQFRNWSGPAYTVAQAGMFNVYSAVNDTWWVGTISAGSLSTSRMHGASGGFIGGVSSPTAGITAVRQRAAVFDPLNNFLVVGCIPSASSNVKYRRASMTAVASFTATNSTQTNTSGPKCMVWAGSPINMIISGHETTGVVETSSDGGATWTNRTVPNADSRLSAAWGTPGICITSDTAQARLIHSTDGINWNQRTLPASKIWNVVWVPLLAKFLAIADDLSAIASSTDGITWTSIGAISLPPYLGSILSSFDNNFVAFGRTVFGVVLSSNTYIIYSQDGGTTWKIACSPTGTGSVGQLNGNGRQLMYTISTFVQWSIGGGF